MSSNKNPEFETLNTTEGSYRTILTAKYKNRKAWKPVNPKEVNSAIPGTVLSILVKPGDVVKENDIILMLTAMKMNNAIKSPISGTVKAIHVTQGDRLPKGQLMIEFE